MNLLTINTHSWLEEEPLKKLEEIAKVILSSESEIIALQEVNQKVASKKVPLEQLTLVTLFMKKGTHYFRNVR